MHLSRVRLEGQQEVLGEAKTQRWDGEKSCTVVAASALPLDLGYPDGGASAEYEGRTFQYKTESTSQDFGVGII